MPIKLVSAAVAIGLLLAYLLPLVVKLKEVSLGVVVAVAVVMMLVDLRQSLRRDD
jgi:uncharacterized membrane protein YgaE (UPF0421/DUF939 family)